MAEWHIDPVRISETWTDEMLTLMLDKLIERKKRINEAMKGGGEPETTDVELFAQMGSKVKVVKSGD